MKIDFGATYKEIDYLLRASTKPVPQDQDGSFEQTLGGVTAQPAETPQQNEPVIKKLSTPTLIQTPMEEVRASYQFEPPSMVPPLFEPMTPAEVEPKQSDQGAPSVKTPTLLDARKVELEVTVPTLGNSLSANLIAPRTTEPTAPNALPQLNIGTTQMPSQLGQTEILARLKVASEKVGLDPALAKAVVNAESGFNIMAVSSDGHNSKGLFQLLDSTGQHLLSRAGNTSREYNPFDPDLNMELGTSYLRYLHDIFTTPTSLPNSFTTRSAADKNSLERFAVAAFNAGEGRVASAQYRSEQSGRDPGHYDNVAPFLPRSTREYVARVVGGKRLF